MIIFYQIPYFSIRIAFPHKLSAVFLLIGFLVAGSTLETDLSDYPENFILLGGNSRHPGRRSTFMDFGTGQGTKITYQ